MLEDTRSLHQRTAERKESLLRSKLRDGVRCLLARSRDFFKNLTGTVFLAVLKVILVWSTPKKAVKTLCTSRIWPGFNHGLYSDGKFHLPVWNNSVVFKPLTKFQIIFYYFFLQSTLSTNKVKALYSF